MADTYDGYANRETWAFCLWCDNDEGLSTMVREFVEGLPGDWANRDDYSDHQIGHRVVEYVRDMLDEFDTDATRTMRDDIGSWWRIDDREVGKWARELMAA